MLKEYYYNAEEIGRVLIKRSLRARRIAIHVRDGEVELVLPKGVDECRGVEFLYQNRDQIVQFLEKRKPVARVYDENTEITMLSFSVKIVRCGDEPSARLSNGVLMINFPEKEPISSQKNQQSIKKVILAAMHSEAKRVLPQRLDSLAKKFNFAYGKVTIRTTKTRWGSCSSAKNISLSTFLMLLPPVLADYVMLHELCHTKEMNHGKNFWNLMDSVTDGMSAKYRQKLKKYQTSL